MTSAEKGARYSAVAIALHWAIAAAILAMIPMGVWMVDAINDPSRQGAAYGVYQLHKSLGFTILALTLARLAWRLAHPVPALPAAMAGWERFLARAAHAAFYALLILLPLSGWIFVSAGWSVHNDRPLNVATAWFKLFQIPHLPWVSGAPDETRRAIAFQSMGVHEVLARTTVALIWLHVIAALKHQFFDRDSVLPSMIPGLRLRGHASAPGGAGRATVVAGTLLVVAIGVGAAIVSRPARPASAPVAQASPVTATPVAPAAPAAAPQAPVAEAAEAEAADAAAPGAVRQWTVDRSKSRIGFAGEHAGNPFKGVFGSWTANIRFDPDNLAGSKVVVNVRTGSAKTGDSTQEGSLSEPEWFDPTGFPTARFEATTFRRLAPGKFEAKGALKIKDRSIPATLPFTLAITGDRAQAEGSLELDRTAFNMGMVSDPTADWVSKMIRVDVKVEATAAKPAP